MTSSDSSLSWRVERALQLAWPALEEQRCGDWLARFARGVSRRANSANPTRPDLRDIERDIAACESAFRARNAPPVFRAPTIVTPVADELLERLGYVAEGETVTLYAELGTGAARDDAVEIAARPEAGWLAAMAEWQDHSPEQAEVYQAVVRSIAIPAGFARLRAGGEWAALAFGAISDGLLCCESVIADPRQRGRGHARRMMDALLAWGAAQGARAVCLQVSADNTAGLALYRSLGLTTELYRYHYRCAPMAS